MQLRPYQQELKDRIVDAWARGKRDVMAVMPTGGGKTVLFTSAMVDEQGASVAIAHRSELVSQMSLTLARNGVRHRVVGSKSVQSICATVHMHELGRVFVDPNSRVGVAGVDTLVRMDKRDPWLHQVRLAITDEAHHLLRENKWGKGLELFPNARGLGVTATPTRADGKGLGRHADGVFDEMVVGPEMRTLIADGYLTDYRIVAPPSDIDLSGVNVAAGGDYSPEKLRTAVHRSHIVGDVVANYLKFAAGKLGITFAVDIATGHQIADAYRAAGVPAEMVHGDTPDLTRAAIMKRFRARQVLQLVNVDLFGEGFDVPAVEVVSMARPTMAYGLFSQQFGRALRPLEGKGKALIIDHVRNVERHGLPDAPRTWTLNRRERSAKGTPSDAVPIRVCVNEICLQPYERALLCCPYCGHTPPIAERRTPAQVEGDLFELDADVLRALRGEVQKVDGLPLVPVSAGPIVVKAIMNRHGERQRAQAELREVLALWGGWQAQKGRSEREAQKRFFIRYGVDVMTAQTLGAREANELAEKVRDELRTHGIQAREPETEADCPDSRVV